jgi:hypothetical protein
MALKPASNARLQARLAAAAALKSGRCHCGAAKQTGMAVCFKCWFKLPKNVRRALYRPMGKGFSAAYEVACQYLTLNGKEELHGKRDA